MIQIDSKLVEDTWKEPHNWTETKIQREYEILEKEQKELYAFVCEYTSEYDEESSSVALWLFFMVFRMYRKAFGGQLPEISAKKILEKHKRNEKHLESLGTAQNEILQSEAELQFGSQPEVWRYITEALLEKEDNGEPVIAEKIAGDAFAMFKTVIELFDDATDQS